jgi:secondary thiamine-phosphate synthase enzyme
MNIKQIELTLQPKSRGFHLVTDEILDQIDISHINNGTIHIFLKHTSASLTINENCEKEVREDMERLFNELCDDKPYYTHTYEGDDDMPAHVKSSLLGCSLTIPITHGKLNLGTWQGIYLGEHREFGGSRKIVLTVTGV